jgi:hypothetical protein
MRKSGKKTAEIWEKNAEIWEKSQISKVRKSGKIMRKFGNFQDLLAEIWQLLSFFILRKYGNLLRNYECHPILLIVKIINNFILFCRIFQSEKLSRRIKNKKIYRKLLKNNV